MSVPSEPSGQTPEIGRQNFRVKKVVLIQQSGKYKHLQNKHPNTHTHKYTQIHTFSHCTDQTHDIPGHRCKSPSRCLYTLNDFWYIYKRLERPLKTDICHCTSTKYCSITVLCDNSTQYCSARAYDEKVLTVEDLVVSRVGHDEVVVRWPVQVGDVARMSLLKHLVNSWTHLSTTTSVSKFNPQRSYIQSCKVEFVVKESKHKGHSCLYCCCSMSRKGEQSYDTQRVKVKHSVKNNEKFHCCLCLSCYILLSLKCFYCSSPVQSVSALFRPTCNQSTLGSRLRHPLCRTNG